MSAADEAGANRDTVMRVARPTDKLRRDRRDVRAGLGSREFASFHDHDGFDGVILGHPSHTYHIEFTSRRGHTAGRAPSEDHLLVFYLPDEDEWRSTREHMLVAVFRRAASCNPFWDVRGATFEDIDGYRIVLQNEAWTR